MLLYCFVLYLCLRMQAVKDQRSKVTSALAMVQNPTWERIPRPNPSGVPPAIPPVVPKTSVVSLSAAPCFPLCSSRPQARIVSSHPCPRTRVRVPLSLSLPYHPYLP